VNEESEMARRARSEPEASGGSGIAGQRARCRCGFSLIEMLAVVAIFALVAGLVLPNVGLLGSRELEAAAEHLRDELEFARQRAIMTARPHRVVLDLDRQTHWIEGMGDAAPAAAEEPGREAEAPAQAGAPGSRAPLSLAPPPRPQGEFEALPGAFGRTNRLPGDVAFAGVETEAGVAEEGAIGVAFGPDGTTSYTQIVLDDARGRSRTLEVLPLADGVRILDEPR